MPDRDLAVRRVGPDGDLPDAPTLWPDPDLKPFDDGPLEEVWLHPDGRTLTVYGLHGFDQALYSLAVEESDAEVVLSATIGFTPEAAQRMAESSEPLMIPAIGLRWCTEVRLQQPLADRRVVARPGPHRRRS